MTRLRQTTTSGFTETPWGGQTPRSVYTRPGEEYLSNPTDPRPASRGLGDLRQEGSTLLPTRTTQSESQSNPGLGILRRIQGGILPASILVSPFEPRDVSPIEMEIHTAFHPRHHLLVPADRHLAAEKTFLNQVQDGRWVRLTEPLSF